MLIFGLDFTSAPTRRKPITLAQGILNDTHLSLQLCSLLPEFAAFEAWLAQAGSWVAACDFPFGLPLQLLQNLGWSLDWSEYIEHVASLGKLGFEETLNNYIGGRVAGDKLHYRVVDRLARAVSPIQLYRVPVGKMFYQGATRLLRSDVSILPCRPTESKKYVFEGYPALVARRFCGKSSYKQDQRSKQNQEQRVARQEIVSGLCSPYLGDIYGLSIEIAPPLLHELVSEPMGDMLDAVLCAVQAAWAYLQRARNYGISGGHQTEGWIIDPGLSAHGIFL